MRPKYLRAVFLLSGLALAGCATGTLPSAIPAALTQAEASTIAAQITSVTAIRVAASSGALQIQAPRDDTVLTPILTADLEATGYKVAERGAHRLSYQVTDLASDLLLRMELDGARAAALFTHTPKGLVPAGAVTIREQEIAAQ